MNHCIARSTWPSTIAAAASATPTAVTPGRRLGRSVHSSSRSPAPVSSTCPWLGIATSRVSNGAAETTLPFGSRETTWETTPIARTTITSRQATTSGCQRGRGAAAGGGTGCTDQSIRSHEAGPGPMFGLSSVSEETPNLPRASSVSSPSTPYVELHCHSGFSFLDGASHLDELVSRALELGYPALALTDHNGLYGSMA